jgi:hypothetical protein
VWLLGPASRPPCLLLRWIDYLGETSELVRDRIAGFAGEQADRATTVAEKVVDAVKEEAVSQGLTLEGAKAAAEDISTKVSRVVVSSAKSISDRANPRKP